MYHPVMLVLQAAFGIYNPEQTVVVSNQLTQKRNVTHVDNGCCCQFYNVQQQNKQFSMWVVFRDMPA